MSIPLDTKLYRLMCDMLVKMVSDIPDEELGQPLGDGNPPSWIIGHLAIGNDYGVLLLGGKPERMEEFLPMFGPGSPATGDHPSKSELLTMFDQSSQRLLQAVESASVDQLMAERESPPLIEELPQVIDMVGHLLTSHIGMHVGQLSAWRRARGMDSILKL